MARLYKTPDILKVKNRTNYYLNESGEIQNSRQEKGAKVDSVQTRLLRALNEMQDSGENLTIAQLMYRANVSGAARYKYEAVYADTLELIGKFVTKTIPKASEEKDIPELDVIEDAIKMKVQDDMLKGPQHDFDELVVIGRECISDALYDTVMYMPGAFTNLYQDKIRVHPAFAGRSVNELQDILEKEYQKVRELEDTYERLKDESR